MSTRASRSSSAGCLVTSSAAFCKGICHPSGIATVLSLVWLYALSCVTSACELRLLLVGLLRDLPSRLNCGMYDTYCSDRRSGLEMAGHLGESLLPPGFLSSWQFNVTFLWSNHCSRFGQLGGGLAWGLLVPFLRRCRSRFGSLVGIVCACFVLLQHFSVLQLPHFASLGAASAATSLVGSLCRCFTLSVVCPRRCTASSCFSGCMLLTLGTVPNASD